RKAEGAAGPFDDGIEHHQRTFAIEGGAGFGGGVDDMRKRAMRKIAVANVGSMQGNGWILREVRGFFPEGGGMTAQADKTGVKMQTAVGPGKTFEQPATKESGGAGDQDALAAKLLPQRLGSLDNVVEVGCQP